MVEYLVPTWYNGRASFRKRNIQREDPLFTPSYTIDEYLGNFEPASDEFVFPSGIVVSSLLSVRIIDVM